MMITSKEQSNSNSQMNIKFWTKKVNGKSIFSDPVSFDGFLGKYSNKKNRFINYRFQVSGNKFAYFKENNIKYRELQNEFIFQEKICDNKAYKLKLKITANDSKVQKALYISDDFQANKLIQELKKYCVLNTFWADFEVMRKIGAGGTSKVVSVKNRKSNEMFAAKVIYCGNASKKSRVNKLEAALHEAKMLRMLKCNKIPLLDSVYFHEDHIIIVYEYIQGKTISGLLIEKKSLNEEQAARIIKSLLEILIYFEQENIIHRDIKLDNIIITNDCAHSTHIKLIDFGLAVKSDQINYKIACGTPGAIAPEVLSLTTYGHKVDIFSTGVLLYAMLSGTVPFKGKLVSEVLESNYKCNVDFSNSIWECISNSAKKFILKAMARDPSQRYTAKEALDSEWIQYYTKKRNSETTIGSDGGMESIDPLADFDDRTMIILLNQHKLKIITYEGEEEWTAPSSLSSLSCINMDKYDLNPKRTPFYNFSMNNQNFKVLHILK